MAIKRIEVKRIASKSAPIISLHTRHRRGLGRVVYQALYVLDGVCRAIRRFFPKRVYLVLE